MKPETFDALSTFFQFLYAIICLFGVGGNSLVLLVIASAKQLHTTSNLYIFSMALGDLIFLLVCTPLNIYQIYARDCWQMGAVACSASFYLMNVSVLVSCFSLCLLSIDRCVALRYPLESIRYRQPSTAIFANMTCWLVALAFPVYKLFSSWPEKEEWCFCKDTWDASTQFFLYLGVVVVSYIIPLAIIMVCYCAIYDALMTSAALSAHRTTFSDYPSHQANGARGGAAIRGTGGGGGGGGSSAGVTAMNAHRDRQNRITTMIASMALLFAIVWGPVHAGTLFIKYELMVEPGQYLPDWQIVYTLVSRALVILGSSLNPIVYSFMGQNFRNHLAESVQLWRKTVTRFVGSGRRHMSARLSVTLQQQQPPRPKTPTTLSTKTTGGGNGIEGTLGKSPLASVTV